MSQTINTQLSATDLRNSLSFNENIKEIQHENTKQTNHGIEFVSAPVSYSVDENHNVIVKVVDKSGKVVMQIPSEEYMIMKRILQDGNKNIFLKKI